MKKIFTLIFSLGLLTSAFAQSGHEQQNKGHDNNYQPSSYAMNSHDFKYGSGVYSNDRNQQWNKGDVRAPRDQYAHNDGDHDRRYGDGHSPKYNKKRGEPDHDNYKPATFPLLQIILSIGRR
jgi:hypothetical protein